MILGKLIDNPESIDKIAILVIEILGNSKLVEALKKDYILVGSQQSATVGNYFIFYIPVKLGLSQEEGDTENRLMQDLLKRFDADLLTNVTFKQNYLITAYWNQWTREIVADVWKKRGKQ